MDTSFDDIVADHTYKLNVAIHTHIYEKLEDVIVQTFKFIGDEHRIDLHVDKNKVLDMLTQYKLGRIYIKDFCDDLNYQKIILEISDVDREDLLRTLEKDQVNHLYRLDYITNPDDPNHNLMYIENCDLQDISTTDIFYEMIEDGYVVTKLHKDERGYYINQIKL